MDAVKKAVRTSFHNGIFQNGSPSELVASMSLAEKAGQLLMIGFDGLWPSREATDLISRGLAGGVILFARNLDGPEQAAELTDFLQQIASKSRLGLPLFIAIDQEGGSVARLVKGVTVFPGNMSLGATGRNDYAYQCGKATALELAALGININLAPALDVNSNPANPVIGVRSFGEDPVRVAALGVQMIRGLGDGGVIAVAKHFPGHGDTAVDSHRGLPVVDRSFEELDRVELVPFQAAIDGGVKSIMSSHIVFSAIDPGRPATLSPAVLTGLLRGRLGFKGMIFTDCLEMGAIAANFEPDKAAVMAVGAGADQLIVSSSYERQRRSLEGVIAGVENGMISAERMDEAVQKVLQLKLDLFQRSGGSVTRAKERFQTVGCKEHRDLARKIAAESLTLLRNRQGILPLKLDVADTICVISFRVSNSTAAEDSGKTVSGLAQALGRYHQRILEKRLPASPTGQEIAEVLQERQSVDPKVTIVATQNAGANPGQTEMVHQLAMSSQSLIVVALRNPYDLALFPEIGTYIAAYGFREVTLEAFADLLWGRFTPRGKLPVSIPGLYDLGSGCEDFTPTPSPLSCHPGQPSPI